jgi:hypothetical protein
MKLALFGGFVLLSGVWLGPRPVWAEGTAAPPHPEHVQELLIQLDHSRFAVRQEADRQLRKLGIGVVPLLRKELAARPPLEVYLRVEAIIGHLMRIKWYDDVAEAQAESARSGKPILVFSTLGDTDGSGSLATQVMLARTFADLELVDYLQRNYLMVWHCQLPKGWYDELDLSLDGLRNYSDEQIQGYAEGRGGINLQSYFCTSDGRVVRYLEGYWNAATYLTEARLAHQLAEQVRTMPGGQGIELARAVLAQRGKDMIRHRQGTGPDEAIRLDVMRKALADSALLIGRPIPAILNQGHETLLQASFT